MGTQESRTTRPAVADPAPWLESFAAFKREVKQRGFYAPDTRRLLFQLGAHLTIAGAGLAAFLVLDAWLPRAGAFALMTFGLAGLASHTHTSSHYGSGRGRRFNETLTYFGYPFLLGMSAHFWWDKHQTHHDHPNVHGVDDDLGNMPFLATTDRDVESASPLARRYYRLQWIALPLIVGLIGVSLQVRSRVVLLRQMRSEGWRNRAHWLDLACLTGHALVWWVGPSFVFGFGSVAAFQAAFLVAMGYTFFVMLAPAHLPAEAACFAPPPPDSDPVYRQVAATANFRAGRLGRWMCSGLDYQIEHHLFRAVPHTRLPALAELTRTFCAHHGYPYRELGWGEGLWKAAQSFATPKTVLEIAP